MSGEVDPEVWLEQLKRIVARKDWDALGDMRKRTNEYFLRSLDVDGLRTFYAGVTRAGLPASDVENLLAADSRDFQDAIRRALVDVRRQVTENPRLKAVYFEYYFDGCPGSSNGAFFLCTAYSDSDDSWAAEFESDGFVEGADLPDFFYFPMDWSSNDCSAYVASEAANGRLLAAVLEEWLKCGITRVPLGFANHDHEMVRLAAIGC